MWIALSLPILLIFFGGALASYGLIVAISVGVKIAAYALFILFFLSISIGLLWIILSMYNRCETKGEKIILSFTLTGLLVVLVIVFLCKLKTTNITIVNESKDEIITEINILPIGEESYPDENKVFDYQTVYKEIRYTDEIAERCKKLGYKYKKGEEWIPIKGNQRCIVCGLWKSESYTFRVQKGTFIITLKTINQYTENFYSVIYDKNAFCTHLGESLRFSYSGEDISLTEHQKADFMPETIDKHLKKEVSKRFKPNLIIVTKEAEDVISGLIVKNASQFTTFPDIRKDKYEFNCLLPDTTYTTKAYFSEWNGSHYEETFSEIKDLTINNDCIVFYFDEEKKTFKQIDSSINYKKIKLDK